MTHDDPFLDALEPLLAKYRDTPREGFSLALVNAHDALAADERLRSWPTYAQTQAMDELAVAVGGKLRHAPKHVRDEQFDRLWWQRFRYEPVVADLVRVGVPFETAEERMDKRLERFRRAFYG